MNKTFMHVRRASAAAAAIGAALLASGCSSLQVGEDEFACTGMPNSVFCRSAREVYEATNDGAVPSPMRPQGDSAGADCAACASGEAAQRPEAAEAPCGETIEASAQSPADSAPDRVLGASPEASAEGEANRRSEANRGAQEAREAREGQEARAALESARRPVRTAARVMRIWVAPYEDAKGDLHAPGFVYTEIEPRRWAYGAAFETDERLFELLEATADGAPEGARRGFNSLERLKSGR